MADVNFRVHWSLATLPENTTLTVGEQWKVWLNQEYFTADVSKFIVAEYVSELDASEFSSCQDTVRVFQLKIDQVNIPDLKPNISACDIADAALYTEEDSLRDQLEAAQAASGVALTAVSEAFTAALEVATQTININLETETIAIPENALFVDFPAARDLTNLLGTTIVGPSSLGAIRVEDNAGTIRASFESAPAQNGTHSLLAYFKP